DVEALLRVLVGPDVAPAVEAAEFGMAGKGQRRQLGARVDRGAPAVDLLRDRTRLQRIDADFIEPAELARLQLRRERRRDEDLALLLGHELADVGRPPRQLLRLGADAAALLEALI